MKVFTYTSTDAAVPKGDFALARIQLDAKSWHPVLITAPTEAAAREAAEKWWADQLEAERSKAEAHRRRTEAMRARRVSA